MWSSRAADVLLVGSRREEFMKMKCYMYADLEGDIFHLRNTFFNEQSIELK